MVSAEKKNRISLHEEDRSGHPFSVTEDLKGKVQVKFRENKQFTICQLHEHFIPGSKGGWCVRVRTSPPSSAECRGNLGA